ncbi:cytochrome P450 [Myxococcota bacterium]|nr:cytochrome P450 [Myxococcota bacterium]
MLQYSPFSPEAKADPHSMYRRLRAEAPVYYVEEYDAWALSTFEDVWAASMDNEHYTSSKGSTGDQLLSKSLPAVPMLNAMDPPEHTRVRAVLRPFFGPGRMRKLEPLIQSAMDELLDGLAERESFDAVRELGDLLAGRVGALAAGFPLEDVDLLISLIRRFFERQEGHEGITPDGLAAFEEMGAYLLELVAERRASPTDDDDPLNTLLALDLDGRRMSDEEIGPHLLLLVLGGFETLPKVFASALHRLWEHPDQRARLVEDPSGVPDAFVEAVRYDMPTQFLGRTVAREVRVRDQTLRPGQPVMFLYASANRDEAEFDHADDFDIARRPSRILSFGHGQHSCLGIHVAKLEGRIALEALLSRMRDYEVDLSASERYVTEFVQGFSKLVVRPRG